MEILNKDPLLSHLPYGQMLGNKHTSMHSYLVHTYMNLMDLFDHERLVTSSHIMKKVDDVYTIILLVLLDCIVWLL
jgi:hypothetical protein